MVYFGAMSMSMDFHTSLLRTTDIIFIVFDSTNIIPLFWHSLIITQPLPLPLYNNFPTFISAQFFFVQLLIGAEPKNNYIYKKMCIPLRIFIIKMPISSEHTDRVFKNLNLIHKKQLCGILE